MATDMNKPKISARTLIVITCFIVAFSAAAKAGPVTYTEGVGTMPPDFPNFGNGIFLAPAYPGTTTINGSVAPSSDPSDWIDLGFVGPGTLSAVATTSGSVFMSFYNDTPLSLPLVSFAVNSGGPSSFGLVSIPTDGMFLIDINANGSSSNYSVSVTPTSTVPEPASLGLVGLGGAGMLMMGRKRHRKP